MFASLVAAQESLHSTANLEETSALLLDEADSAIDAAEAAESILKDATTLRKFSTLLGETKDKQSLVRLADTDGSLSTLMGMADTEELLTMSMESLGDTTSEIAQNAEASVTEGDESAKAAVKAKRKKAILATCAALAAVAATIAGYKLVKGRMSKEQQDTIINTINDLKPEGEKITDLPENPTQVAVTEINKTITELKESANAAPTNASEPVVTTSAPKGGTPRTRTTGSAASNLKRSVKSARRAEAQFKRAAQRTKTA